MVKIHREESDDDRLEAMLAAAAARHGCRLDVEGWTRKTFDFYTGSARNRDSALLVRVESFVLHGGEIRVYDDRGLALAQEIGEALERDFGVAEAVIVRDRPPE